MDAKKRLVVLLKRLCKKPLRVCVFYWTPVFETVQETLARLRWWKTQPPKSPLSGGLSTQFPPDKGGRGVRNDKHWVFAQSLNGDRQNMTLTKPVAGVWKNIE